MAQFDLVPKRNFSRGVGSGSIIRHAYKLKSRDARARVMATKRPPEDQGEAPASKRPSLLLGPLDIGPATGEEDLEIKILQVGITLNNTHYTLTLCCSIYYPPCLAGAKQEAKWAFEGA